MQPCCFRKSAGRPDITWLVDEAADKLADLRSIYGSPRTSSDWRQAIADPDVDLVDICLPDHLHFPVAKAALQAGKHVYCEKPFTSNAAEAAELAELAEASGLITRVGHNFPRNPAHDLSREIVQNGEIGETVLFRASMHVDVLADPATPFMWRCDATLAPTGAVGDIATHIFSYVHRLLGPIEELIADVAITTKMRPYSAGFGYGAQPTTSTAATEMREVTSSDIVTLLCNFEGGGRGVIDVSRVAAGHRFLQSYGIYGTKGAIEFHYDEVNRLRFYSGADSAGRQGFRAIDVGAENSNYAAFLPVANFALGYNEFKAIEVCEVIEAVASGAPKWPTFRDGHQIMKIVDACLKSSASRAWAALT